MLTAHAANLAHDGLDDDIEHRVGVTPVITGIEIVSDPGDDDTYQRTDTIDFKVSFNIDVGARGGRPQLNFVIGDGDRVAISNGSSENAYHFLYYVRWNDQDAYGISFKADALNPNGARLQSAAGLDLVLSSDAVQDDAGHRVDGSPTLELYGDQSPVVRENHRGTIGRYVQTTGFYGQGGPDVRVDGRRQRRLRDHHRWDPLIQESARFRGPCRLGRRQRVRNHGDGVCTGDEGRPRWTSR